MAKIGSYIHYNYINYLRNNSDINSVFAAQRNAIKQRAMALSASRDKTAIKNEIENTLNFFRGNNQKAQLGWTESDAQEVETAIEQVILKKLSIDENVYVNFDTLDVYDKDAIDINLDKKGKGVLSQKGNFNSVKSIETRLKMLEASINNASVSLSSGRLQNITSIVRKLQTEWQTLMQNFTISAEAGGMSVNGIQAIRAFSKTEYNYIKGADNFIVELNKAWTMFDKEIKSYLKGEVAEYYAGIVSQVVKTGSARAAQELLGEFMNNLESLNKNIGKVGQNRSAVALQLDRFAVTGMGKRYETIGHRMTAGSGEELFTDFSGGELKLHSTQDKVDLIIDLQDGGTINASLKNYNTLSGRNITVHSGVSILSLMQEDGDFLNHYLNITASVRSDKPESNRVGDWSKVTLANRILKESMTLRAIAGGILKFNANTNSFGPNAQAEILILNDNNGMFKVYFIDDLINKIMSDVQRYVKIDGIEDNTTWEMVWVGNPNQRSYSSAYSRINALLSSLHAFKLHISLSPTLFS